MTIKVLEKPDMFRARCPKCQCLYSYEKDDIKYDIEKVSLSLEDMKTYYDPYYFKGVNPHTVCPRCDCKVKHDNVENTYKGAGLYFGVLRMLSEMDGDERK